MSLERYNKKETYFGIDLSYLILNFFIFILLISIEINNWAPIFNNDSILMINVSLTSLIFNISYSRIFLRILIST